MPCGAERALVTCMAWQHLPHVTSCPKTAQSNLTKPFLHTRGLVCSWPKNNSCLREYCFPDLNQNFFACLKCIGFHFYINLTLLLSYIRMCLGLIMILKFCALIILQLRFKATPPLHTQQACSGFSCSFTELSLIWGLGHGMVGKEFYF